MSKHSHLVILTVAVCIPLTWASGCATIVNGTRQTVEFQSQPACASVLVDGRHLGGTPVSASLERNRTHHVRIGLPGYMTMDLLLERKTSGWAWGNLLLGSAGLIGIVVDALSGSMYSLSPRHLEASAMLGHRMATVDSGDRLVIVVALAPEPREGWVPLGALPPIPGAR